MDNYSSHLPVLEALDPKPKRVLEFGAGEHSTAAFLAMDSVTRLVSVETDMDWRERVSERFSEHFEDGRWRLLDEEDPIPDPTDFDLVFIDDGDEPAQRLATIVYVLGRKHPKVVIHDADYRPYLETISAFGDYEVVGGHTAIVEAS